MLANFPVEEENGELALHIDSPPARTTKYSEASLPTAPPTPPKPLPPPKSVDDNKKTPLSTPKATMLIANDPAFEKKTPVSSPKAALLTASDPSFEKKPPSSTPKASILTTNDPLLNNQKQSLEDIPFSAPALSSSETLGQPAVVGSSPKAVEEKNSQGVYVPPNSSSSGGLGSGLHDARGSKMSTGSVSLGYSEIGGKSGSIAGQGPRMICMAVRVEKGLALCNVTTDLVCRKCGLTQADTCFDLVSLKLCDQLN
jgi:hypothetical protein